MFALRREHLDLGRLGALKLVMAYLGERRKGCVVFDGPRPERALPEPAGGKNWPEVVFSAPRSADEIIMERIAGDSAPRRLIVVSSDREIRRAARRRRCKIRISQDFAADVLRASARSARPAATPAEPPEKHEGLSPEQSKAWLEEFGLDD